MFSIVFVTYNSGEVIGDAIRSIPPGNEIIVVDNASTDNSVEICRSLGATVLEMPKNLGFGTACNRGAEVATTDNILFLNPDARLAEGALEALAQALHRYPDTAAFNPRLLNEDGTQFLRRRTILLPRPYLFRPPLPTGDESVVIASGAALLMRKKDFQQFGGFDENIFLYYEDDDLSARILKSGRTIRYVHSAIAYHRGGCSSKSSPEEDSFKEYEFAKSKLYVLNKHGIRRRHWLEKLETELKLIFARKRNDRNAINSLRARIRALKDFG
jgi:GT2 family glycosyltransferase